LKDQCYFILQSDPPIIQFFQPVSEEFRAKIMARHGAIESIGGYETTEKSTDEQEITDQEIAAERGPDWETPCGQLDYEADCQAIIEKIRKRRAENREQVATTSSSSSSSAIKARPKVYIIYNIRQIIL